MVPIFASVFHWHPRWDVRIFPGRTKLRSLNKQITCSSRVFQGVVSRRHSSHMLLTQSSLPCCSLLSKNYNALARDPLSIPLLNLRPYYRMPCERGPVLEGGRHYDSTGVEAIETVETDEPRRFVVERGWHRLTVITCLDLRVQHARSRLIARR